VICDYLSAAVGLNSSFHEEFNDGFMTSSQCISHRATFQGEIVC